MALPQLPKLNKDDTEKAKTAIANLSSNQQGGSDVVNTISSVVNTISNPIGAFGQATAGALTSEPDPSGVRFKDFIREVPEATVDVAKEVGQGIARSFLSTGAQIEQGASGTVQDISNVLKGKETDFTDQFTEVAKFDPQTDFQKKLAGTDKPVSFRSIGNEVLGIVGAEDSDIGKKAAVPLGIFMAGLDVVPGVPKGKAFDDAASLISKTVDEDVIKNTLKNLFDTPDEGEVTSLARGLKNIDNKDTVKSVLDSATKQSADEVLGGSRPFREPAEQLSDDLDPLVRDAQRFSDADSAFKEFQKKSIDDQTQQVFQRTFNPRGNKTPRQAFDDFFDIANRNVDRFPPSARNILGKTRSRDDFVERAENTILKRSQQQRARGAREASTETRKTIKNRQDELIGRVVDELPVDRRGTQSLLTDIRDVSTELQFEKASNKIDEKIAQYKAAQEEARKLGKKRSKVSFIRKVGDFEQKAVTDSKKTIGVEKSVRQMDDSELDALTSELIKRLKFKTKRGLKSSLDKTAIVDRDEAKPYFSDDFYETVKTPENLTSRKPVKARIKKSFKDAKEHLGKSISDKASEVREFSEELLTPITTRLKNIDPELKTRLRKTTFDTRIKIRDRTNSVKPFIEKVTDISSDDLSMLDIAVKNGDNAKAFEIASRNGFKKELEDVYDLLDDMYKEAQEVGYDIDYREGFFPRIVEDSEGLQNYLFQQDGKNILEEAIQREEMRLGRHLNDVEKSQILNTLVRGYRKNQIALSRTGNMKERVIDFIDPELNQFYKDSTEALTQYIRSVTEAVEARRFFGKQYKDLSEESINLDDSIGAFVNDLMAEGKLDAGQAEELRNILNARFNPKGTGPVVGTFKDLGYIETIGGIDNAVTQLGDMYASIYVGGTGKGLSEGLKSALGKAKVTKEDIGLANREILAEFSSDEGKWNVGKLLDKVFRFTGFNKMDRIGAESLAGASLRDAQIRAAQPDEKFLKKVRNMFPEKIFGEGKADEVMQKLRDGVVDEDTKFYAFNTVNDFSPRTMDEMPQKYLEGGNGRVFYMLKTWTIRTLDAYRNEVFDVMKEDKVQGLKNMVRLTTALTVMGATADTIKDVMMGREIDIKDRLTQNMFAWTGVTRYTQYQAERQGVLRTAQEQILPPIPLDGVRSDAWEVTKKLFTDYEKSTKINELDTIRDIPVGGDLLYWWFGKGAKRREGNVAPRGGGSGSGSARTTPQLPQLPQVNAEASVPKLPQLPSI